MSPATTPLFPSHPFKTPGPYASLLATRASLPLNSLFRTGIEGQLKELEKKISTEGLKGDRFVYKIFNEQKEHVATLLGTYHLSNQRMCQDPVMLAAFNECDTLFFDKIPDSIACTEPQIFPMQMNVVLWEQAKTTSKEIYALDDIGPIKEPEYPNTGQNKKFSEWFNHRSLQEQMYESIEAFQNGQALKIYWIETSKLSQKECDQELYQRHKSWMTEKLLPALKTASTTKKIIGIVTSAHHLIRANGSEMLIPLFEKEGFTVTRVCEKSDENRAVCLS